MKNHLQTAVAGVIVLAFVTIGATNIKSDRELNLRHNIDIQSTEAKLKIKQLKLNELHQELDEILKKGYRYEGHEFVIDTPYLKQAILDRHNKQVEIAIFNYRANILSENYATDLGTYDYDGIAEMVLKESNNDKDD